MASRMNEDISLQQNTFKQGLGTCNRIFNL